MTDDEIKTLFHSDLSLAEVRNLCRVRHGTVVSLWKAEFGAAAVHERKRKHYRLSKLGTKNPMSGKIKSLSYLWKGGDRISNRKGYYRVRAPEWFTGPSSGGYADEHVVVYCESRGITSIPKGFVVHHLDMDKKNNSAKNLVMLPNSDHTLLHAWITRAVVQRLSKME